MEKEAKNYGRAYAFFDCDASKADVEDEIVKARYYAETPSNLELSLTEGEENLNGDADFINALAAAKKSSLSRLPKSQREDNPVSYRYALKAKLADETNLATANKLKNIMNLLYGKKLYTQGEEFFGEIVYQRGDRYVHAH